MQGNGKKYKCCFCGAEYDTEYKDSFFIHTRDGSAHKINHLQMHVWNKDINGFETRKLRACTNCIKAFMNGYLYCASQHNLDVDIESNIEVEDEIIEDIREEGKV